MENRGRLESSSNRPNACDASAGVSGSDREGCALSAEGAVEAGDAHSL